MTKEERGAVDARDLLRALAGQAMQENGLADAQGAASVSVVPSTATAAAAGMDIGTPRYEAAVGRLLEAGALERDEENSGGPEAFRITAGGIDLLKRPNSTGTDVLPMRGR